MTGTEYQELAMRTCSIPYNHAQDRLRHGVFGLCAEAQEFWNAFEDVRQEGGREHAIKELGDITWMAAEISVACRINIDTMKRRIEISTDAARVELIDAIHAADAITQAASKMASIMQKEYQGHQYSSEDVSKLIDRILTAVAFEAVFFKTTLDGVMETNIAKLKARYPEGFTPFRSLNRAEGDV